MEIKTTEEIIKLFDSRTILEIVNKPMLYKKWVSVDDMKLLLQSYRKDYPNLIDILLEQLSQK